MHPTSSDELACNGNTNEVRIVSSEAVYNTWIRIKKVGIKMAEDQILILKQSSTQDWQVQTLDNNVKSSF
jgi:hypothetical protein